MMPLGQHLSSDQDAGSAASDAFDELLEIVLPTELIAIDTMHRRAGKALFQQRLEALGAGAQRFEIGIATVGAASRLGLAGAAMMTLQTRLRLVPGHVSAAAVTVRGPAAGIAHEHRRIAASISIQEHLPPLIQVALDLSDERRVKGAIAATLVKNMPARLDGNASAL
jgi:hypothetical protein